MSQQPLKLFATMSERYPEPDGGDAAYAAVRSLISLVPGAGGPVDALFSLVLSPSVCRRRDEWFRELADIVEELGRRLDGFHIEDLARNEAFVSAAIQATRIAVATQKRDKREILRNAVLNVGLGTGPDEDTQQIFFNIIDAFTASHVRILDVLWRGPALMGGKNIWDQNRVPMNGRNYGAAIELAGSGTQRSRRPSRIYFDRSKKPWIHSAEFIKSNLSPGWHHYEHGVQFMLFVLHPDERP